MNRLNANQIKNIDARYLWHPYASMPQTSPSLNVVGAKGVRLQLDNGTSLIDGMSSWWCVIHGYNHPVLNEAIINQLDKMAHVMFGGFTHEPAAVLGRHLVQLTPPPLNKIFFSDSGSVSVEVAIKMALQYWQAQGNLEKSKLLALKNAYHGDTFAAMSVCDPDTGMHHLFSGMLAKQIFAESPPCPFDSPCRPADLQDIERKISTHSNELAAVILEPVVQGAGGMRFYSPQYLRAVRELCDHYDVLLIADEIATGFGRTGKLFACEWADISPDIMCVGKALTGGYMTLAATLCTDAISEAISSKEPGLFMHGPTFMANPLACAVANASIELLLESPWQERIALIESRLRLGLAPCTAMKAVNNVRVLGAIGVVEMKNKFDIYKLQNAFVAAGIWLRPFGKLIYVMPPYVISEVDIDHLTATMVKVISQISA